MFQNETIWRFRLVFAIVIARTVPMVRQAHQPWFDVRSLSRCAEFAEALPKCTNILYFGKACFLGLKGDL